jgi:hypothetical protein
MYLLQIFLPLKNNHGIDFPAEHYTQLTGYLTEKYQGLTAYTRSPAIGLWKQDKSKTVKDEIVIFEVMTNNLNVAELKLLKEDLEKKFKQQEIVIRSFTIEMI